MWSGNDLDWFEREEEPKVVEIVENPEEVDFSISEQDWRLLQEIQNWVAQSKKSHRLFGPLPSDEV